MTTVCTLLRGDSALTDAFLLAFAAANLRADNMLKLIAGCNNDADKAKVEAVEGAVAKMVNKFSGQGDERDRIEFVADLWSIVLAMVETSTVILWDDDIRPNDLAVSRLLSTLAGNAADGLHVAGVVSIYPFRDAQDYAVLFNRPAMAIPMASIPRATFECFAGGNGLSAWFTDKLKPTLPWHVRTLPGGAPAGTDIDIALKLDAVPLKTLCDGRVRSEHLA